MKLRKRIFIILLAVVLVLQSVIVCFAADGEENEVVYTNAYNDLIANKSFDPNIYPKLSSSDPDYYKLEVITIAESDYNELFVYVYQPSGDTEDLRASYITISRELRSVNALDEDPNDGKDGFKLYELEYLNNYNQFYKYKVKDLNVGSDPVRFYEITDILRPFNENYGDKDPGHDNTVSNVPYPVGKQFTFKTASNGTTLARVEDIKYITITDKYVGYARYDADSTLPIFVNTQGGTDCHFVAFSADVDIDKLLEADVYYEMQSYFYTTGQASDPWRGVTPAYAYLDYEQEAICEVHDGSYFVKTEHIWDRIMKTSDFIDQSVTYYLFPGFGISDDIEVPPDTLAALANTDWVLSFKETPYVYSVSSETVTLPSGNSYTQTKITNSYVRVGNVKLLRLKFETGGKIYDLGVVDNMQSGSDKPSIEFKGQEWWERIMMILSIILLVVILSFLQGPLGLIFKIIWRGIKIVFKILVWILSRPWAIFRWLLGFLDKKKKPKPKDKGSK